jgi:predicted Zn-dependent peptidase
MTITQTSLPNGIRIVSSHMPDAQSVSICIFVGAGSRYEDAKTNGISHFLEHMFFMGTKLRPTSLDISRSIEQIGGDLNAYTSEDKTSYYVKVPLEYAAQGMDTLSDMLTQSKFDQAKMDKERSVIIEEINLYQDDPGSYVMEILPGVIWPDSPLGFPVIGPKENLRTITRDQVLTYIDTRYRPDNLLVSVAGPMEHALVEELVEKHLGGLSGKADTSFAPASEGGQTAPRSKIFTKQTDQTHLIIALRGIALEDPQTAALRLLSVILGSGMSSRLFQNVREQKGLAYSVYSSVDSYVDTGLFYCKAGVTNEKAHDAISAVIHELKRLRDGDLSDHDLEQVKTQMRGGLRMSLDGTRQMANWTGSRSILTGKPRTIEDALAEFEKVTLDELKSVASQLIVDSGLSLAVVGPHQEGAFDDLLSVEKEVTHA